METYTSSVLVQDKSLEDHHMDGSTSIGWTFPGSPAAARGEKKTSNTNLSAVALVLLFAPCFGSFVAKAKVVQIEFERILFQKMPRQTMADRTMLANNTSGNLLHLPRRNE
jgi:hypothetical protein